MIVVELLRLHDLAYQLGLDKIVLLFCDVEVVLESRLHPLHHDLRILLQLLVVLIIRRRNVQLSQVVTARARRYDGVLVILIVLEDLLQEALVL